MSRRTDLRHTVAYALVALLALGVVAALPFALGSLVDDPRRGDEQIDYGTDLATAEGSAFRLHLDFTSIDVADSGVPSGPPRSAAAARPARTAPGWTCSAPWPVRAPGRCR